MKSEQDYAYSLGEYQQKFRAQFATEQEPEGPVLPPAFDPSLVTEWDQQDLENFPKAIAEVSEKSRELHEWLKDVRRPEEADWKSNRDQYDMAELLSRDKNREKSINERTVRASRGDGS